jgi:hypothetical protein
MMTGLYVKYAIKGDQMPYALAMGKRTSLILDTSLMEEAARILGTRGPTATVRKSLEEVVRREKLKRVSEIEFPEDALERLWEMRRPRTFDFKD